MPTETELGDTNIKVIVTVENNGKQIKASIDTDTLKHLSQCHGRMIAGDTILTMVETLINEK